MQHKNSSHVIRDLNEGWQFRQSGKKDWYPATVPGCVHLDLLNNKLIDDPFYRDNETKVQWIENENWDYQLVFDAPPEVFQKKQIQLIFEGLDTYTTVILNGKPIIAADNMYRPWPADVKSLLRVKQNLLQVYFRSPIREILPRIDKLSVKLPAVSDPSKATSPYTRKAPYHFGWDWGPRLVTSGIWQSVKCEAWDHFKIADQKIILKEINKKKALLEISTEVLSEIEQKAILQITDDEHQIAEQEEIWLGIGSNFLVKNVEVKNPELWWPSGYGEQRLYNFQTEISIGKEIVSHLKRIGLRTLELKREDDQWGESFTFVVNGVPMFAKGADWIPSDNFTMRVSAEKYRYLLTSAVRANMNMLRVWGGGIYEADAFYDLCDELGILIWQDFMFSCALYPGDEKFLNSVEEEAFYQVRRLRHHPCIALWCGNNEIEMGWHSWGWQQKFPFNMWEDYLRLFHGVLPKVCQAEDPTRIYWASSPASDADAIYNPNDSTRGDTHYWGVWHGQEPFDFYKKHLPRFISEYGFQSFPESDSVDQFTKKEDHDILSPVMLNHQKSLNGNPRIKEYMEKYFVVPNEFYHFLWLSQVLQAEGIKIGAEHFRRIRPRCMGSIYWQLNDCWPVASWSSIDYYGRWKALHYYARRFYAPVLISPNEENGIIQFYVISDKREAINAQLQIRLMDFEGAILANWDRQIVIRPYESAVYFSLEKSKLSPGIDPRETLLYCGVENDGKLISENTVFFARQKDLKLPLPEIDMAIAKDDLGFQLSLVSKNLARAVILKIKNCDGHLVDNFFDLYPGITRTVRFLTQSKISEVDFKKRISYLTLHELMER